MFYVILPVCLPENFDVNFNFGIIPFVCLILAVSMG